MKNNLLIISLLTLLNFQVFAQIQGLYFCRNYKPKDINGASQNWSVVQDKRGVMYFANNEGVLEYDGTTFRKIQIKNKSTVRSLAIDSLGTIYVGCVNEFGFLTPDKNGILYFYSLADALDKNDRKKIAEVYKTYVSPEGVYFCSYNGIVRYQPDKPTKFKIWYPKELFNLSFYVNNHLYTRENKLGLLELKNDNFEKVEGGNAINNSVYIMLPYENNKILIGIRSGGFYIYNPETTNKNERFVKFKTEIDDLFSDILYCGSKLKDGNFLIGSIKKGAALINQQGKLIRLFNKANGLIDNSIYSFCENENNIVWITANAGLAKIDYSDKFVFWNDQTGINGTVNCATKCNQILYAGTNESLYYLDTASSGAKNNVSIFKQVEGLNNQVWSLVDFKIPNSNTHVLIVGASDGVYELRNNKLTRIVKNIPALEIVASRFDSTLIYIGINDGFAAIKYTNGKWNYTGKLKDYTAQTRSIVEDKEGNIWLGTRISFIYKMILKQKSDFESSFKNNNFEIIHYDTAFGLPYSKNAWVQFVNNQIYATTDIGIYIFNSTKNKFEPDNFFGKEFNKYKTIAYRIKQSKDSVICVHAKLLFFKQRDNQYQVDSITLKRLLYGATQNIYTDHSIFWFTYTDGIVKFDKSIQKNYRINYQAIIRKVIIHKDSVLFGGKHYYFENDSIHHSNEQRSERIPVLPYKFNSLVFEFSAPFFEEETQNQYSYFLDGYDNNWSEWTKETKKEYTNLDEGLYVFHIKAKNIYGIESAITTYTFKILSPWYRTWWAFILYFLLSCVIIFVIVYLNGRRLKAANLKLEKIVKERTQEIVEKNIALEQNKEEILAQNEQLLHQKEEIQSQAEELEKINIELEKLSIVASETDNSVMIMDAKGNFLWINQGATKLYGYSSQEFFTMYSNIYDASSNTQIKTLVDKCIESKQSVVYNSEAKTKCGNIVYFQTTLTPILNENNQVEKLVAIDSDITKLMEAEKIIHEKNEQITASIRYAKTIQNAILPFTDKISQHFENFILFKPKDIVSGDFYWFTEISGSKFFQTYSEEGLQNLIQNQTVFYFAVVDCTGHGVPGAFMSMISSRLLNEIINEKHIYETNTIINTLDELINISLQQKQTDNNDGMDLAIIRVQKNEKGAVIQYTGAKNSIYYADSNSKQVVKIKADKRSIGGWREYHHKTQFTTNNFELKKNDVIYMLTDGFIDQNNHQRKRFGSLPFMNMLAENNHLPLDKQKIIYENALKNWQQDDEQRDDITLWGIRI